MKTEVQIKEIASKIDEAMKKPLSGEPLMEISAILLSTVASTLAWVLSDDDSETAVLETKMGIIRIKR